MSSKAVNHPMDRKKRDADINNKLQLYGIYSAFAAGKLPSNKQCDVALNSAANSKWLTSPSTELSEDGRTLVNDLRAVIEQTKLLFLTKNQGELLQEFIWDAQHITADDTHKLTSPVQRDAAQQDATKAAEGFKTLGTLLITNGEFRKLLSDAVILFRDIAGDAASNAAAKLKPGEEELAQIDTPAQENVWHEKPNISKEQLKAQFREQAQKFKPADKKDVDAAVEAGTQAATSGRDGAPISEADAQAGAAAVTASLQQATDRNVAPEDKEKAKEKADEAQNATSEYARRTREFLGKKMPKERRDQVVWRLKKMIVEIQGHSDYQQAIETLLTLAETYGGHGKTITQQGSTSAKGATRDTNLQQAGTNLRTLIERFANSTSTDDFFDSLNNIYRDADRDPRLKDWFKHADTYIRKCLREQGFVLQDAATTEWNRLYDEGRFLLRDRYRNHTDRIGDEIKFLANQFDEDPQNRAFRQSLEKLFKDLGQDQYGKPVFKPHLVKDITNVIIPEIFQNVRYVPIPRIEVSDPAVDMVIENLVIESDNLMPNVVELGTDNYWRWGRKKISNKDDHKIMIAASGIQADIRDVSYYVKKKQGFPSISDTGVMDLFLGGEGVAFKIAASKSQKSDNSYVFKVDKVNVNIKNLDIKLKKSKHKILFNIFKPMLYSVVRPALEKILEKQIRSAFEKADAFAYEVQNEARRAREAAREDPEQAANIFSRYADAARQIITEKKKQAEAIAQRDTAVQMSMTHQDALFKEIKLPGDITNKATEYKEQSTKGERWQSPIFDWGNAAPSKNLPKTADITRKPHTTAEATLRESTLRETNGTSRHATNGATNGNFKTEVDRAFDTNPPVSSLNV
ncbi:hypothetical protein BGW36DRAFT_287197 [Talaromyces proteolyticus]|uniref:Uncharacterized protein n=1 Tax=Talaromyces proteolyticus TaxID=1131652 RepID=A0AAD4Q5E3_9EURO|nr:uncharacterized protein BGW36DRAFT_287197 [Talaromyces proteolyticus]KAH8704121.1 hypothetical protein BGW36DRAFT_287197 [Talaromyces proteolyticus]